MITVNAIGDNCPIPVVKTRKALQALEGPGSVAVLVDNEIAVQNVMKMASASGGKPVSEKLGEKKYKITISMERAVERTIGKAVEEAEGESVEKVAGESAEEAAKDAAEEAGTEEAACVPDRREGMVVVVSSDRMGSGNDELGRVLLKGFLFALTQLDALPGSILFYNGGAAMTCEGSDSLEDLKSMEAQGVEILTCGTCLDYYGLKEKLAVGSVTNMYSIVEKLAGADRILRP